MWQSLRITEDIELSKVKEKDSPTLFALVDQNRDYLRQWFPWVDKTKSLEDIRKFINSFEEKAKENKGLLLGIWYQGSLCGLIDLHDINLDNRKSSIGYWISAPYQGKGIMTESCQALIDYAFHDLNLNRIEIRCATENKKSRAIPERLGFTQEGTIRQAEWLHDHFVDHIVYGILTSEWKPPIK